MQNIHFLFVTIEGGGNIPQMFGLMKKLLQRGHTVNVLTEPCLEEPVKDMNCNFLPFTEYFIKKDRKEDMLKDWNATLTKNPVFENVVFGPAETVINQTLKACKKLKIDFLVVDMLLLPALIAGEALNIPRILIFHMPEYLPGKNRPPGNMGLKPGEGFLTKLRDKVLGKLMNSKFNEFKSKLNKIRANLQLPPLNNTFDLMHTADLRIIQTLSSFDIPLLPPPSNVRYSGPVLDDPDWVSSEKWVSPWNTNDDRPMVVISFSSTFQNQADVMQNCINALKDLPVKGLVTLGTAMEEEHFDVPENVKIMHSVKHSIVFPETDLVITHAGHGTVIRALAYGVPLLCLPMGRDQKDNAIKVEMKGCGIKLPSKSNAEKINKATRKILKDSSFKINADKLKKELQEFNGLQDILIEIENSVNKYHKTT